MAVSRLRWLVLALSALTIMGAYYGNDAIAPIAELLRRQRNFTQSQIGLLNAVYNLPNIPLAIVGGVLIDRIGAARAALGATVVAALGAIITAWGEPYSVMLTGRLLFGLGQETLYIALLVNLAQWFRCGWRPDFRRWGCWAPRDCCW